MIYIYLLYAKAKHPHTSFARCQLTFHETQLLFGGCLPYTNHTRASVLRAKRNTKDSKQKKGIFFQNLYYLVVFGGCLIYLAFSISRLTLGSHGTHFSSGDVSTFSTNAPHGVRAQLRVEKFIDNLRQPTNDVQLTNLFFLGFHNSCPHSVVASVMQRAATVAIRFDEAVMIPCYI